MIGRVSRALAVVATAATVTLGLAAPAHADSTVVVHGTRFPDPWAQLAYVGCTDIFTRDGQVLAPTIGFGGPSGARSLGYDLAGGTAIGSQHIVSSVLRTNVVSLSVNAPSGSSGRAVVGYQSPADAGTSVMWFGVAPISAPAGGWTTVTATPRSYSWTKYDMSTRTVLEASSGTAVPVLDFVSTHGGDGPGLYALTFGCDGAPFSMDAMRVGYPGHVTTYDLEGISTSLGMNVADHLVKPGQDVTLRGNLVTSNGAPVSHATVILERRDPTKGGWENIRVVSAEDGSPIAKINPTRTALYRWRFVDRPLAEGSTSAAVAVVVNDPNDPLPTDPTDPATPTDPTSPSTPTPTGSPTPSVPGPSDTSSPSASPSDESTDPTGSTDPTDATPSGEDTPSESGSQSESTGDTPTPTSPASEAASASS